MIVRIGMDLVEVDRIRKALERPGFLERILTEKERDAHLSIARIAGRWAAKEAIAKAVGIHLTWHDVEIVNDESGAPIAKIDAEKWDSECHKIHLTITHEKGHAAAVAILEKI